MNLTPHTLNIQCADGAIVEIAPSGQVARVAQRTIALGNLKAEDGDDIPVMRQVFDRTIEGLPAPEQGTIYVVSSLVLQAVDDIRDDVFAPGAAIRDDGGCVVGCQGLSATRCYQQQISHAAQAADVNHSCTAHLARGMCAVKVISAKGVIDPTPKDGGIQTEVPVIEVKVKCDDGDELIVKVPGFTKLTPRAARAALEITKMQSPERCTGDRVRVDEYGYIIYKNSARKVYFGEEKPANW